MKHRLILPLLFFFGGFAPNAHAVPIIDKRQAVAPPRTDSGTGICGSVTHFASAQPLDTKDQAVAILNKPTTDPAVLGRTARLFDNINFRNGQSNTNGDFTMPSYRDECFPYSSYDRFDKICQSSSPMGTDYSIALRLRGYFNVPATLTGKVIDFGVNCDDFCSLAIGTTQVVSAADELISARVIKQVTFADAGLYPVEMIYYQNGTTAYLEWARTNMAVAECPNDICVIPLTDPSYMMNFNIIAREELYSSVIGTNAGCQECGAAGMSDCSMGNYCGDGLCQSCSVSAHCGPTCQACPGNASKCVAGVCASACTSNAMCPSGTICDLGTGTCTMGIACTSNAMCPSGTVCDLATGTCMAALSTINASGCQMSGREGKIPWSQGWVPWAALLTFGLWRLRRWSVCQG